MINTPKCKIIKHKEFKKLFSSFKDQQNFIYQISDFIVINHRKIYQDESFDFYINPKSYSNLLKKYGLNLKIENIKSIRIRFYCNFSFLPNKFKIWKLIISLKNKNNNDNFLIYAFKGDKNKFLNFFKNLNISHLSYKKTLNLPFKFDLYLEQNQVVILSPLKTFKLKKIILNDNIYRTLQKILYEHKSLRTKKINEQKFKIANYFEVELEVDSNKLDNKIINKIKDEFLDKNNTNFHKSNLLDVFCFIK